MDRILLSGHRARIELCPFLPAREEGLLRPDAANARTGEAASGAALLHGYLAAGAALRLLRDPAGAARLLRAGVDLRRPLERTERRLRPRVVGARRSMADPDGGGARPRQRHRCVRPGGALLR